MKKTTKTIEPNEQRVLLENSQLAISIIFDQIRNYNVMQ